MYIWVSKKPYMRYLLAICFIALSLMTYAQESPLTGIWELKKTKNAQGTVQELAFGVYKIFSSDGKFSNMQLTPNGAILTHQGVFELSDSSTYVENVRDQQTGSHIDKAQTQLNYKLSENGDVLTLEGLVKMQGGAYDFKLHEEWQRVKLH